VRLERLGPTEPGQGIDQGAALDPEGGSELAKLSVRRNRLINLRV
jgi:hypothetical protein